MLRVQQVSGELIVFRVEMDQSIVRAAHPEAGVVVVEHRIDVPAGARLGISLHPWMKAEVGTVEAPQANAFQRQPKAAFVVAPHCIDPRMGAAFESIDPIALKPGAIKAVKESKAGGPHGS